MSEQPEGNDPVVDAEIDNAGGTDVAATEVDTAPEAEVVEDTRIPISRLNEVIAQREAKAQEAARYAYENEQLRLQLQQHAPRPVAPQTPKYGQQFQDANTRALAALVYEAAEAANAPLKQQLARYEQIVEKQEADTFWSRYPAAPVELKQHAEKVYNQARASGLDIDRRSALIFARGELAEMSENANLSAAQASVTQQRAVNGAARTPTIAAGAPVQRGNAPATKADDILAELERDFTKRR